MLFIITFAVSILSLHPCKANEILEPFSYFENFEEGEENAWASYPLWQDTAYDPLFKIGTIVPGDKNYSIDQTVEVYTHVDSYAGAQKLLDMYLTPDSLIRLRYYIKSHLPAEFITIRIAAGSDGTLDYTVHLPTLNRWNWLSVTYTDMISQNPRLAGKDRIKINALALLTKIPDADPGMVYHFGLDDVLVRGSRTIQFRFIEPEMYKLSEWAYYFPKKHFRKGDFLILKGDWPIRADRVTVRITSYTDSSQVIVNAALSHNGDEWSLTPFKLNCPHGMYLATLEAYRGRDKLAETGFTFLVVPDVAGSHPRLLFDKKGAAVIKERLHSEKYKPVLDDIITRARTYREKHPVESIIYDFDQFNDVNLLIDWDAWNGRARDWGNGIRYNALTFEFTGDTEALEYAVSSMVKQSEFPDFSHPWMRKRGRLAYWENSYVDGFAIGYDLLYDFMDEQTRQKIRHGIMKNIVSGSFETFVKDNAVTSNMSNWIAHIAGNPLMNLLALYGDEPAVETGFKPVSTLEPFLTGHIYKINAHIEKSTVPGAYGEGYSYYNYTMLGWSKVLSSLENVLNIDLSARSNGTYRETIWAGIISDKKTFHFGDSHSDVGPLTNFAWLLDKNHDPLLGWAYNYLKNGETFEDVLYDTDHVPQDDPFDENPVRLFREIGTTVFKSGWGKDDFVFVMRTGPFFNHQHFDQGTFWLADHGNIFIEERSDSEYDNCPYYRPWFTKPAAHSTILIDWNHQSQRGGDPLSFADGFNDHAFVSHFLDGDQAAFVSGDIGRLYWGKVQSLQRNVLYVKPRTILILDTIEPGKIDRDVTLLFQTTFLKDILAGNSMSSITRNGEKLSLFHVWPEQKEVKTVKTPHYYYTLRNTKPLIQEGMLTVTSRTHGEPLVMATLMTTEDDRNLEKNSEYGRGYVSGTANGQKFVFSTRPYTLYHVEDVSTDALVFSKEQSRLFIAMFTFFEIEGVITIKSNNRLTCECIPGKLKYSMNEPGKVTIRTQAKPETVTINGTITKDISYDPVQKEMTVFVPAGEGVITY